MKLLDIVQQAVGEIGDIDKPVTVADNNRLFNLAKRSIYQLITRSDVIWDELIDSFSFVTVLNQEDYALPADFHSIVNGTAWDEANEWLLEGPVDAARWQELRRQDPASSIRRHFRIAKDRNSLDRKILIFPTPTVNGDTITFEYQSSHPVKSSIGTTQKTWQGDDDEARIDAELVVLDFKWRILRSFGMPYAEEFRDFETSLNDRKMRAGQQIYSLAGRQARRRFDTKEGDFTL